MIIFYTTINDDGLVQFSTGKPQNKTITFSTITEWEDFIDYMTTTYERNEYSIYCSSSLDFPEDYTSNPVTLDICERIRG